MTYIERKYGIPRSTLSGWFKDIPLSEEQRTKLMKNSEDGWKKARQSAVVWHRQQKELRLKQAEQEAQAVINNLDLNPEVLDLALAMLYLGEGAKKNTSSLASSDPKILKFILVVLERNYSISKDMVRCELHLRADQNANKAKSYWSKELGIPINNFKGSYHDQRTAGKKTYDHYKGVCVLYFGPIAIQRKLVSLYNLFCEKVSLLDHYEDD